MTENTLIPKDLAPRKLTQHQARMEHLLYWSGKSIPERLAAMTALTRRMYKMRGIDLDERNADFTPSRVRRREQPLRHLVDAEMLALIPDVIPEVNG
jgi:hypothetical protein